MSVHKWVDDVLGHLRVMGSVSIEGLADLVIDVCGAQQCSGEFMPGWTARRVGEVMEDVLRVARDEGFAFDVDPDGPGIPDVITSPTAATASFAREARVWWVVDGGHEWLRVPLADYPNAMDHATGYGYLDHDAAVVYLEGDVEAATFLTAHPAMRAAGLAVKRQDGDAPCRTLPRNGQRLATAVATPALTGSEPS